MAVGADPSRGRGALMPECPRLRLGTRGSALALVQTELVARRLQAAIPGIAIDTVVVRTEGDTDKTTPLTVLGGRGVFTSGPEAALLSGEVDAAVHSAKDLPTRLPEGCSLAAFPERADPGDVFVSRHGLGLDRLPPNPVIGTSSRRREVQVRAARPDAVIVDLRGNIDTRLRRALDEARYDGVVLAAAGLERMGWASRITERLSVDRFVPSPAQGALAVEVRADDEASGAMVAAIDDPLARLPVLAERAFLRALGAGCAIPVGALATWDGGNLVLRAMLAEEDGTSAIWERFRLDRAEPEAHAAEIALRMRERTARAARAFPVTGETSSAEAPARVLVTRPAGQATALGDALRRVGAVPVFCPTIEIGDPVDWADLDGALRSASAGAFDWVVLTSANAVQRVTQRLAALGLPHLGSARLAAVGEVTAAALATAGLAVELVPDRQDAEGLAAAMRARGMSGQRVLYPHGSLARETLPSLLAAAGATVTAVEAYRTVPVTRIADDVLAAFRRGEIDVLTFASPSSVEGLANGLEGEVTHVEALPAVCVGEVTAAAARAAGFRSVVVARRPSANAVADAVAAVLAAGGEPGRLDGSRTGLVASGRAGGGS